MRWILTIYLLIFSGLTTAKEPKAQDLNQIKPGEAGGGKNMNTLSCMRYLQLNLGAVTNPKDKQKRFFYGHLCGNKKQTCSEDVIVHWPETGSLSTAVYVMTNNGVHQYDLKQFSDREAKMDLLHHKPFYIRQTIDKKNKNRNFHMSAEAKKQGESQKTLADHQATGEVFENLFYGGINEALKTLSEPKNSNLVRRRLEMERKRIADEEVRTNNLNDVGLLQGLQTACAGARLDSNKIDTLMSDLERQFTPGRSPTPQGQGSQTTN